MSTLLVVNASFRTEGSVTRAIAESAIASWQADNKKGIVLHRDLSASPLPADAWALAVGASYTPAERRSPEQQDALALVTALADEIIGADAVILASPLFNFGVSQLTKVWLDLLISDPRLGPGTSALNGKPTVLITAQGGSYAAGTPREGWDYNTPYLQRILAENFGMSLETVVAELTLAASNPALAEFIGLAEQSLSTAHARAGEHASAFAARLKVAA